MNAAQSVPAQQRVPSNLRILPEPSSDPALLDYLSASRLKCWQTCRRQFFFRYVERIETMTAPALFIGQQVHECLRSLNWARWKSEPLDADQLRGEFDESWERGLESESVPWKKEGDEPNAKAQAWAMLETYFAESPVPYSETPEGVEVEVSPLEQETTTHDDGPRRKRFRQYLKDRSEGRSILGPLELCLSIYVQ